MENTISYEGLDEYFDMVKISASKVYNTARRSGVKAVQPELKEELYQSGMIALMEAWGNYDSTREASFRTFAFYRIRGAMLDYLRGEDTVSRSTRAALKKISSSINNTMTSTELNDVEIAKAVKNSVAVFQYIDPADAENSGEVIEFPDTSDHYGQVDAEETIIKLFKVCPLSEKEKTVLTDHYFVNKNFSVIGKSLGVTESRISQIHKSALKKLAQYV